MSLVTYGLGPAGGGGGGGGGVYLMRAYHTVGPIGYVYWESPNNPDPTATLAPYPLVSLTDILVTAVYPG
jgi:hypothetical protein